MVQQRLGSIPAPGLVLTGIATVQFGAALAKNLFDVLPPSAVVFMRLLTSVIVLGILTYKVLRRVIRQVSWADLGVAAGFGLALGTMNFAIYESFSRIPLGIAVTIEFLGPLAVSVAFSRHKVDLLWVGLAATGVVLLGGGDNRDIEIAGVLFALLAAVCWAAYILLSAQTGRRFPGSSGLTIASLVGALAVAPVGLSAGGTEMWRPEYVAIGVAIGLLSSVIPYALELEALRRMPARVFGILMSLEPAVAALVGLLILGEVLHAPEWLAIGCVVVASVGAARSRLPRRNVSEV